MKVNIPARALADIAKRALDYSEEMRSLSYQDVWGQGLNLDGLTSVTASGEVVSADRAMTLSAVYGSVRIISNGVATIEPKVIRNKGEDNAENVDLPHWLEDESSDTILRHELLGQVMVSLLLRGNAYILVLRAGDMSIRELIVLDPEEVEPYAESVGGKRFIFYRVRSMPGTSLTPLDILHIRGEMKPGAIEGLDPISYAAETVGVGLAAQKFGGSFFGNGAAPGAVIEIEDEPSQTAIDILKNTWNSRYGGAGNAQKLAILTGGMKFKPLSVTPENAQFLQTRGFQVADVARFFGVPPHLLADATGSTSWGSGLQEQSTNYAIHTLAPWVKRLEAKFTWLLRTENQVKNAKLSVVFPLDHLLRGDFSKQIETYKLGIEAGIFEVNEVRGFLGLPPIEEPEPAPMPVAVPVAVPTEDDAPDEDNEADANDA